MSRFFSGKLLNKYVSIFNFLSVVQHARVAQWIRRCPPKAEIAGSSPAVSILFQNAFAATPFYAAAIVAW